MKANNECVLLIGTHADEATNILRKLSSPTDERFRVEWIAGLRSGIDRLHNGEIAAVVLDLSLPDSRGIETFDRLFQAAQGVPILVLSGAETEEMARQTLRLGARDYLRADQADGDRLRRTLRTMLDGRAAEAMRRENEVANITLDSIGEAVLRTDLRGTVTYLNQMAERMTGWRRDEAMGCPVTDVFRTSDGVSGVPIDHAAAIIVLTDKAAGTMTASSNCVLVRRDGVRFGIENIVTLIHNPGGSAIGAVMSFHDVSAARATSLELSHLAQHDVLTNLPNRVLFNDRLAQAISMARRHGRQLAVLFVDLDYFKKINDSLGHATGDKLLQSVAKRLQTCVRRSDTVSRLGGDEFVVLLSQMENEEDAAFSARKILRALGAPHIIAGKSLDISVSVGGSTYPGDGKDAASLMNNADAAMYEAKHRGRNNYQFFRRDMHARAAKRLAVEGELRYALGRDEFVLHYQPRIDLQSGRIAGVEALLRWQHPQRGMLLPAEFLPIAEECGLILSIGRWVLLEACRQARRWSDSGLGAVPVSVNVSASEFGAKDFLSAVRAVLIATKVEPENLELELTESVLMQDAETTVDILRKLRAMGVHIAIDDFGTGYSSFTYLKRFPVDALKIDQSFVHDVMLDSGNATIVSAMINIGTSLKQRVVAEGVETRAQVDFLQSCGCGEAQGYYFSRPVVAEQAEKLIQAGPLTGMIQ